MPSWPRRVLPGARCEGRVVSVSVVLSSCRGVLRGLRGPVPESSSVKVVLSPGSEGTGRSAGAGEQEQGVAAACPPLGSREQFCTDSSRGRCVRLGRRADSFQSWMW